MSGFATGTTTPERQRTSQAGSSAGVRSALSYRSVFTTHGRIVPSCCMVSTSTLHFTIASYSPASFRSRVAAPAPVPLPFLVKGSLGYTDSKPSPAPSPTPSPPCRARSSKKFDGFRFVFGKTVRISSTTEYWKSSACRPPS
jgi:hypothetical protein